MFEKIKPYPAILEPCKGGYGVYFPDLPGTASGGKNYEDAIRMAKECLSLHLYGMLEDGDDIPPPSPVKKIKKQIKPDELIALIEPDIFSIKAQEKKDKSVRIDISIPQSLLRAADNRAQALGLNRSKLFQKALREVL